MTEPFCCLLSSHVGIDHVEAMRRSLARYLAREYAEKHRKLIPWRRQKSS